MIWLNPSVLCSGQPMESWKLGEFCVDVGKLDVRKLDVDKVAGLKVGRVFYL